MKIVRTDAKRRITLPGSQPGEVYEVVEEEPGHYSLARMVPLPTKKMPKTVSEVERAMESAPLTPVTSWEKLRKLTRQL